ncbi:PPE domain-containing protein [Streptomyces rameus]|uniref:PPE domain-containing protein n=1 Tax=Streptomyces rameus TaxID=68261 RepID=A0ABN3UXL3_9ACTN
MDFNALYHANFKLLDDAVTDWSTLVKHLGDLKKDAEDDLHKAALKADWAGVNAQVSREFVGKTAGEFGDAHTQATTIHNILSDTQGELKSYHQQLKDAVSRGEKKNLTVVDAGDGKFTVTGSTRPDGNSDPSGNKSATNQKDVDDLRDEIQGILSKATESDNSAKTVLMTLVDQAKMGFSDASYANRDDAADAVKEADELAKLAKKNPDDLSVQDFDRLNAGLKKYANDPLFAERFAHSLGPQKTLEFWTGISDPNRGNYEVGHKRLDQLDDLQRNLGLTLAHATQSDSTDMTEWKRQMIDLGDKPLYGDRGGPMGFQVMSNLMRTGDYDDQFLKDYGTKLMATERKMTGNGEHGNPFWQHLGGSAWLNRIGDDSGNDPLTGYLKGLSNSPDAATDFFNEQYISKDDPDNPFERDTDGNGKKGRVSLSNFQYLFEERDWPQESNLHGDDIVTGQNNLALALEAATTGHPAGEMPTADTPPHSADQAKLMRALVDSVSDDPSRVKDHSYMSDSLGQIGSEYLPDIHRAMADGPTVRDGKSGWELLYPLAGTDAKLDHSAVTRFLVTVSQNPEGYAALNVGEKAYTASLMDYHLNPDLPADQHYPHDAQETVTSISRKAGEFNGLLAQGRQEAVLGPAGEKDSDYDYAVSQKKNFISGLVGTGVGVGTSFIASPVVGAGVGGAAGTVTSMVLEAFYKDDSGQYRAEAGQDIATRWETIKDSTNNINYTAAHEAAKAHHADYTDQIDSWVSEGTSSGFNDANTDIHAMAKDMDTAISG